MRVIFRMRAAAPGVATRGAILAVSAVFAAVALTGCGQRGPLYLPTVPPLPAKPSFETQDSGRAATAAATGTSGAEAESIPDTSGNPLTLSPDTELGTTPSASASPPAPASATPNQ